MRRTLSIIVVAAFAAAESGGPELEKARAKVRTLELEIEALIGRVAPAVGAVMNHTADFDESTGRVTMSPLSLGSGCVVSPDGFFLTNVHVVEGAGYLTVALPDGQRYPATLFADTSEGAVKGDIALLKLRGSRRFPFVDWRWGSATRLEPGSFVFAMGNPHGHALDGIPVVTMGILSGSGRAAAEAGYLYIDAIQTDAEINPGNSGGPLFDSRGNLIGINGLMNSRQGRSNSGVGFAIPIDQVKLFMGKLIREEGGGVGYGFHGLEVSSADGEAGARVTRVRMRSPAALAGICPEDVIVTVNGERISNRTDFVNVVGKLPEKSLLRIRFKRGKTLKAESFRLCAYDDYLAQIGLTRETKGPLPLHARGYLGVLWEGGHGGVRITEVVSGTGAGKAGLKVGDQILKLDGVGMETVQQLAEALALLPSGTAVKLGYQRGGRARSAKLVLCDAAAAAGLGG